MIVVRCASRRPLGVRDPRVYQFVDGVLIMELGADAHGNASPRQG